MKRSWMSWLTGLWVCVILFAGVAVQAYDGNANDATVNNGISVLRDDYSVFPGETWLGEQIRFEPELRNGKRYLRHMGDPAQNSHFLLARTGVYYGEWKFSVIFDGFTSSNQNRVWIWLMADDDEIPVGYGIRLGENGSQKYVRLFRLRGDQSPVELLQSTRIMPDNGEEIFVHVRRQTNGTWDLGVKSEQDASYSWSSVPEADHATHLFHWFGFRTHFTSTRADKFLLGPVELVKYPVFVRSVEVINPLLVRIVVSEPTQSLQDIRVRINGQLADGWITANGFEAFLHLRSPLRGGSHRIEIEGLYDNITGQEIQLSPRDVHLFDTPERFDVVITEFLPRPVAGETPLFFELYNRSEKQLDLSGWSFCRSSGSWTIGAGTANRYLAPGEYVVLTPNPTYFNQIGILNTISLPISTPLRTQDRFCLRGPDGTLIDSLAYNSSWSSLLKDGVAVERKHHDYIGMDINNWRQVPVISANHSAGRPNALLQLPEKPLEILFASEKHGGDIELLFSQFVGFGAGTRVYVNNQSRHELIWNIWTGNRMIIPADDILAEKGSVVIELSGIETIGTGEHVSLRHEVGRIPQQGDLRINEIMYQPLQERYASHPDQSEYVEIRNTAPYRITLEDIYLHDTPDKHGVIRTWIPENSRTWWVEAHGHALIIADTIRALNQSRTARFFGQDPDNSWVRVNRSTLGLTSGGRGVYLAIHETVLDSVYYSPNWHHPLLSDPRGISLEFIGITRPDANASTGTNRYWISSVHPLGGTPGYQNSVSSDLDQTAVSQQILTISPNPFSPDQDGHHDVTRIHLSFPKPGFVVRVRVYDRRGVHVQTLEHGAIAGTYFETTWGGTTINHNLADTGVYLVVAELMDPDGGRLQTHVKPVVLVRGSRVRHRF